MSKDARNKTGRPTIQAIAEEAGVSRATVSLILANRKGMVERFKPATVQRVREVAERMGYHANIMAISLRSQHPSFFALILRGAGTRDAVSWHHQAFEGQFLAGALEASRSLGLYPVLATQDDPDHEAGLQRVRGVLDGGVFGAVIRTPAAGVQESLQRAIEHGLPVAIVFPEDPTSADSNTIDMDNVAAGRLAGQLLHEAGRSRWGIVHEEQSWEAIRLREDGARAVGAEFGADVETLAIPPGMSEKETQAWLAPKLKDLKVDGIFAASSVTGVGTLLACQASGLRVPDDACLVGCDASLWRAPGCPAITSVDVSWHSAGEQAVRKMAEICESGAATFDSIKLPPHVRKGDSCPGGDEEPATVVPQ